MGLLGSCLLCNQRQLKGKASDTGQLSWGGGCHGEFPRRGVKEAALSSGVDVYNINASAAGMLRSLLLCTLEATQLFQT